ncbi:hypothetical protein [Segatella oris]|uniref:hypothetical protein n=1 Tax=Segatella oris TaxID=28135 RepID=UPI0003697176|nr:hypothetical protein [Segatella oris]
MKEQKEYSSEPEARLEDYHSTSSAHLSQQIQNRERPSISENSAKPPIFADEELVKRTEESFEVKIKGPIIIELYAKFTPPRDPYSHLLPHEDS